MNKLINENSENSLGKKQSGSNKSSFLKSAILGLGLTFAATTAFSQTEVKSDIPTKDLKKQYSGVMKALKKDDRTVSKAADVYGTSAGKVAATLSDDVSYIVKELIPTIYVDHITIKTYLKSGLNGQNIMEWLYLNKKDILWGFSQSFGTKVWEFETNNAFSDKVKYPVGYIDNNAGYAKTKQDKKRLKDIEDVFKQGVDDISTLFETGKITLNYPLKQIYDANVSSWGTINVDTKSTKKHSLKDYIMQEGFVTVNDVKMYQVKIDLNKYKEEELDEGVPFNKSKLTETLTQNTILLNSYTAMASQCSDYISEGTDDMQGN